MAQHINGVILSIDNQSDPVNDLHLSFDIQTFNLNFSKASQLRSLVVPAGSQWCSSFDVLDLFSRYSFRF